MAYLFDTDAVSELLRHRPARSYVEWIARIPREEQFTSAIVIGELYRGAFLSVDRERHLANIELRVLPALVVLPLDSAVARRYGKVQAALAQAGRRLADADAQIAATALHHGLALVTGNLRHFERVPGLKIERALVESRTR
jgi:predicted nucleic acid-binding protein